MKTLDFFRKEIFHLRKLKIGHTKQTSKTTFLGMLNIWLSINTNLLFRKVSGKSFEQNVFEMYKNPATDLVNIDQILTVKRITYYILIYLKFDCCVVHAL